MDQVGNLPEEESAFSRINPIQLAWGVIFAAFTVFSVLCVTSVLGVHYFFFQSSLSLDVVLQVGRGTVGVRSSNGIEQAESDERTLSEGAFVRTDQTDLLSQAVISLHDPKYDNSLIASITLKGDTSAQLHSASRPRFRWSSSVYYSEIEVSGDVDVLIADDLNRDIQIIVRSAEGAEVRLEASGRYSVQISNTAVQLTNHAGQAVLIAPDRSAAQSISEGQKGVLNTGSNTIALVPMLIELVTNSGLQPFSSDDSVEVALVGWSCTNGPPNNLPNGDYRAAVAPDGRPGLRLVRGDGADTNAYTKCEQTLGPAHTGIEVSSYDYLALQAIVYVGYQSLSRCGEEGSECPLMVRVYFRDSETDTSWNWIHGLYARDDPGTTYPFRCSSCIDNHVEIYDNVWYTYISDNLLTIFNDRHPTVITGIEFFAEGHQYDVYVDEISLLAGYDNSTGSDGSENTNDG